MTLASNNRFERSRVRVFGVGQEGVDDWDKVPSFEASEAPRRSTSSLAAGHPTLIRNILIVLGSIIGFVLALVVIAGIGLYLLLKPSRDEVARVISPNGHATATITEINGGATTPFGYDIELFSSSRALIHREVASLYGATRSPIAYGVDLHWKSDSELDVEYWDAKDAKLLIESVSISGNDIRVVFKPHTLNPAAPQGGMLYNREHGRGES